MAFQRRSWAVERAAWGVLVLLVTFGALGLLTHGPLSESTVANPAGTLSLSFERLERKSGPADFKIALSGQAPAGEAVVRIGPEFTEAYSVEEMTPRPLRARVGSGGFEGTFATSSTGELHVDIRARGRRFGRVRLAVEVDGAGTVSATQIVFP